MQVHKEFTHGQSLDQDVDPKNTRDDNDDDEWDYADVFEDDEEWDKVVTDNVAGGEPSAKEIPPLVPEYVPANVVFPMKKSELYSYQKASWKLSKFTSYHKQSLSLTNHKTPCPDPEAKEFIPTDPNLTFVYTSSGIVPLEIFDELRKPAESRSRLFFTKMQPYYRHWSGLTDEQQVKLYLDAVQPKVYFSDPDEPGVINRCEVPSVEYWISVYHHLKPSNPTLPCEPWMGDSVAFRSFDM